MGSDSFTFKKFQIIQRRSAMKVGTDGVLIGAWARVEGSERRILDIGTGTGLIALMMAQRCPGARIDAVEIEPGAAEEARENVAASPWCDRVFVYHEAFQSFASRVASAGFSCATSSTDVPINSPATPAPATFTENASPATPARAAFTENASSPATPGSTAGAPHSIAAPLSPTVGSPLSSPTTDSLQSSLAEGAPRFSPTDLVGADAKYDLIVSNPPYFDGTYKSTQAERTAARHVELMGSDDIIEGVVKILGERGRFCAIFPYQTGAVFIAKAASRGLYCNRILEIYPKVGGYVKRIAAEFSFERGTGEAEVLYIEDEGGYSGAYRALTRDFYLRF